MRKTTKWKKKTLSFPESVLWWVDYYLFSCSWVSYATVYGQLHHSSCLWVHQHVGIISVDAYKLVCVNVLSPDRLCIHYHLLIYECLITLLWASPSYFVRSLSLHSETLNCEAFDEKSSSDVAKKKSPMITPLSASASCITPIMSEITISPYSAHECVNNSNIPHFMTTFRPMFMSSSSSDPSVRTSSSAEYDCILFHVLRLHHLHFYS